MSNILPSQIVNVKHKNIEIYEENGEKYFRYSGTVTMDDGEEYQLIIPKVSLDWKCIDIEQDSYTTPTGYCTLQHQCYLSSERVFMELKRINNEEDRLDALLQDVI